MMQYTIRKALPHDVNAIIGLCAEHAMYEQAEYQTAGKAERLLVMLFDEQPRLQCLLVELAYEIIGYATFSQECSTWCADYYIHLDCLYLKEAYRGFGIGEALINGL
jgi:GNAT superfamily N-acetyltransferase